LARAYVCTYISPIVKCTKFSAEIPKNLNREFCDRPQRPIEAGISLWSTMD
jgi:hypothetical protein